MYVLIMASSVGRRCLWMFLGVIALAILASISCKTNSGTGTSGSAVSSPGSPSDTMIQSDDEWPT